MKHIEVYNRRIHYDLDLEKKITILKGDSGTGKTVLIRMIHDYSNYGPSSGITLISDYKCTVLTNEDWEYRLQSTHHRIVFIDQNNAFVTTKEFINMAIQSGNDFVIVCRREIFEIPDTLKEICILRECRNEKYTDRTCNEMVRFPLK